MKIIGIKLLDLFSAEGVFGFSFLSSSNNDFISDLACAGRSSLNENILSKDFGYLGFDKFAHKR
ncbi:MAG: hypothetical protein HQL68_13095 [Magnetococcales bacterium]|nr:hypothetical protein [Magnetococcales bacterium]